MMIDVTGKEREEAPVEQKHKKPNYDWSYENSINTGKEQLSLENQEFKYEQWRTNSVLSIRLDTIFHVNIMNLNHHISDKMHYDFLYNGVRKTKRFGKKKTEADKIAEREYKEQQTKLALIKEYYKYNQAKALTALSILTEEQLEKIKIIIEQGGSK